MQDELRAFLQLPVCGPIFFSAFPIHIPCYAHTHTLSRSDSDHGQNELTTGSDQSHVYRGSKECSIETFL